MIGRYRDSDRGKPIDDAAAYQTRAGTGARVPFAIEGLAQPGVWTPRPWSKVHPDTGSGDPSRATAEKGEAFFHAVTGALADLLVNLAKAEKGDLPYV